MPNSGIVEGVPGKSADRERSSLKKIGEHKELLLCFLYAAAVLSGELAISLGSISAGMVIHIVLLLALLVHSSIAPDSRSVYLALALAPMIRIVSLSMPLGRVSTVYWFVVIGLPVFIAAFLVARLNGYGFRKLGMNFNNLGLQLLFSLSGIGLGYIEYHILKPAPLLEKTGITGILTASLILLVFTGLLEELVFRSIMFSALRDRFDDKIAVLLTSVVFAALHVTYNIPVDVLFVFLVAILFSMMVIRFRSILGVSIAHGLTNMSLFIIFPLFLK